MVYATLIRDSTGGIARTILVERGDESPTKDLNMTEKLKENQAAKSVDSIDWLNQEMVDFMQAMAQTPCGGSVDRTIKEIQKQRNWRKRMVKRLNKHHMISYI